MLCLLAFIVDVAAFLANLPEILRCWRVVLALCAGFGAAALVHALIPNKDVGMVVGFHIALAGLVIGLNWHGKKTELKP